MNVTDPAEGDAVASSDVYQVGAGGEASPEEAASAGPASSARAQMSEMEASRASLVSALELLGATATRLKRMEYTVGRMTDDAIRASLANSEERRQVNERMAALETRVVDLERIHRKLVAMLRHSNDQYNALAHRMNEVGPRADGLVPVEMPVAAPQRTAPAPTREVEEPAMRPPSLMGKVAGMLSAGTQPKRRS